MYVCYEHSMYVSHIRIHVWLCYNSNSIPDSLMWVQVEVGLAVRVFTNGPGDLGSIPGRVIPKTQKMVLDASLLNTQHYKVRIKGKVEPSREGVAPSPTSWCSSYRKGILRVTLNYGRQLYFTLLTIKTAFKSIFQKISGYTKVKTPEKDVYLE